jgi:hypothetical protein
MGATGFHGLTAALFDMIDVRKRGEISFSDAVRFMKLLGEKLPSEKQDGINAKLSVVLNDLFESNANAEMCTRDEFMVLDDFSRFEHRPSADDIARLRQVVEELIGAEKRQSEGRMEALVEAYPTAR